MPALQYEPLQGELSKDGWHMAWYGLYAKDGDDSYDCHAVFTVGAVNLIFNLSGSGVVMGNLTRLGLSPSTMAMCFPQSELKATRIAGGGNHEFLVLTLSVSWLEKILGKQLSCVYPAVWKFICGEMNHKMPMGHVRLMSMREKEMMRKLSDPPVCNEALSIWYSGKVMEIISLHLFAPAKELGSQPLNQAKQDRVEKVIEWLRDHLEEALDLKLLATEVGCAPHYLSRLFSAETGRTLSQQLRALRIEEAARLMDLGRHNVTEACFEVGYNSLSHFTKAFLVEKGVKPSEYLKMRG